MTRFGTWKYLKIGIFFKKNASNNQPYWGYNGMCNHQYDHMRLSENGARQKKAIGNRKKLALNRWI